MHKNEKKSTVLDLLKSLKPYFFSELFCPSKFRGFPIRGKAFKIAFHFNPTLFNVKKECIAKVELEAFAAVNDSYLRKTKKLTELSNYVFQGKTPLQFLNIISRAGLTQSKLPMSLFKQIILHSLPDGQTKLGDLLVTELSNVEKDKLPDIYKYMMNYLIDMFDIPLRDIDYYETDYLAERIKHRRFPALLSINFFPTGMVLKDGKKTSRAPAFHEILACNLTDYGKAHLDTRYDATFAFFSTLYDELSTHFGPFPTSKETFHKHLHLIASCAFKWMKDKKSIPEIITLLNTSLITESEVVACPLMYFIHGILEELLSEISQKTPLAQCLYSNCAKFYLDTYDYGFCSKECKVLFSSQKRYQKNRETIKQKARLRAAAYRKENREQRGRKERRKKLITEFSEINPEKLITKN